MADYEEGYEYDDYAEDDTAITAEDCWTVISSFFETEGLVSQQLRSYNEFTSNTLQQLVDEVGQISLDHNNPPSVNGEEVAVRRYEIKFNKIKLAKPAQTEGDGSTVSLLPQEARLRNATYACPIYLGMTQRVSICVERPIPLEELDDEQQAEMAQTKEHPTRLEWIEEYVSEQGTGETKNGQLDTGVFIGRLPVMLKSQICALSLYEEEELFENNECPYDQGGYFIINGSEKVLIAQERSAANIVQVFKKPPPTPTPYIVECRSALERGSRLLTTCTLKLHAKGDTARGGFGATIKATLPFVADPIPIAIVFRALGIVSDEDILNHICFDRSDTQLLEMLKPSIEEAFVIQDREIALDYIGKRSRSSNSGNGPQIRSNRIKYARDILLKELLPHVSQKEGSETRKAFFLGYMIHKMLQCALGRRETDDRDHFGKKRLDLAGPLLAKLFRNLFRRMTNDMTVHLKKCVESNRPFSLSLGVKDTIISNGLKYSLATGNWGEQKKAASATAGVSQVLNRYTFASTLSHLRRTNTPIGRDGKIAKPRQLHNTHWGLVCPAETPEGQACGLVKNLSLMCYITVGTPSDPIIEFMIQRNMEILEEYEPLRSPNATKVFVNGVWVGVHRDPAHLAKTVLRLRRTGIIEEEVSIMRDIRDREFKIFTDAGRVCRPLFVVDNDPSSPNKGNLVLTKDHIRRLEDDQTMPSRMDEEQKSDAGYYGFQSLLKEGVVEYVDAEEEETIMIVMTPEDLDISRQIQAGYQRPPEEEVDLNKRVKAPVNPTAHVWTHCEIHPSMILGVCASIIPFPDHNQVRGFTSFVRPNTHRNSLRVILISQLWANKLWASSSPIMIGEWIQWLTSFTTLKSLWQQRDQWSS